MAENARPRRRRQRGGARISTRRKANRAVYGSAEAGGAPSSARPAGVGLSQDGPASHGRIQPALQEEGRRSILRSAPAQATRPEVERSTGARVEGRLQRSERGIFSAPSRGAARQTEVARSSTLRRRVLTRHARTHRATRVRGLSRERNRERGGLRSIARSRSNRRKAPWAHGWRCL